MDMKIYRESEPEQHRRADLYCLLPSRGTEALEVGARDGHLSRMLTSMYDTVIALDIAPMRHQHPRIVCVQGDACSIPFHDNSFDLVLCAETLEHIPVDTLPRACMEIARVAKTTVIIGVPYRQDIRVGRTTCRSCGKPNPPWGHVSSFDEARLRTLFPTLQWEKSSFIGQRVSSTNALSAFLMDLAGNPYGTYDQEEVCIYCRQKIFPPTSLHMWQKVAARFSLNLNSLLIRNMLPRANWIHVRFAKPGTSVRPQH
jgi:hypothetical protein